MEEVAVSAAEERTLGSRWDGKSEGLEQRECGSRSTRSLEIRDSKSVTSTVKKLVVLDKCQRLNTPAY